MSPVDDCLCFARRAAPFGHSSFTLLNVLHKLPDAFRAARLVQLVFVEERVVPQLLSRLLFKLHHDLGTFQQVDEAVRVRMVVALSFPQYMHLISRDVIPIEPRFVPSSICGTISTAAC